ncbi:hypothetical protein KBX50_29045 [Micromonospora sp. C51]|uniref:hypothetical protein n=1 Tax=Micromonospora sp. C51 TaxID=2824879 RepID=UPI001B392480|nr:hypothetical protein [Micromonospora sp. C51]MBQ1052484.1 hypothetical protein [Micromonospora sp. C51]
MEIRDIGGQPHTDIAGAAQLTGRSEQTVRLKTSPKQRAQGSGWPAATIQDRKAWFPLDALQTVRDVVLPRIVEASRARVHHVDLDGDPDELLSASEFRSLLDISQGGWDKYVGLSKVAWDRGEDGYLPRPDDEQPAPAQGVVRYWRRQRIQDWINARTGKVLDPRPAAGSPPKT